jgi:hypothetical protein
MTTSTETGITPSRPSQIRRPENHHLNEAVILSQALSGGKDKLGSISKQGDRYLRSLFTAGALAVIRYAKIHGTKHRPWGPTGALGGSHPDIERPLKLGSTCDGKIALAARAMGW